MRESHTQNRAMTTRRKNMKKCLVIFVLLVAAVMVCVGCAEEKPEESITYRDVSELTSASESVTSSETAEVTDLTETAGQNETEFSVDDLALPEAVDISKCKIIPENYSDHSEQLKKLGYVEGTEEYKLYDTLLDISCQLAAYKRYPRRGRPSTDDLTTNYYRPYRYEISDIAGNLLFDYDVGLAPNEILPPQMEFPDEKVVGKIAYEDVMTAAWQVNCGRIKDAVIKLKEYFSSDILGDYEYRDSMLALLSATLDKIAFAEPYVDDPMRDDTVDVGEEYDEALGMVRITVTTTCKVDESTYPGTQWGEKVHSTFSNRTGMSDISFESYTEREDGINTLVILIKRTEAYNNCVFEYFDIGRTICLINKIGMRITYYYHSDFPYFLYPEVDWDETVTVENEHLHKALTKFFYDLKGTEGYTRRDLSFIEKLEIVRERHKDENGDPTGPKFSRIYMYLDTRVCKIYYPEYEKNGPRGSRGGLLPPASQYYVVEGEWIEDIPQSDMDLFIALKYLQSADET